MITLDLDLAYLSKHYNIGSNALRQYKSMSITEIMEAEAKKGNKAASEFMMKITNNPELLVVFFKLVNPQNKYAILSHMNQNDLMNIMQFLEPQELILGLSIFRQEALIELMMKMEPQSLATVILTKMPCDKFLKLLPEEYLNEFLSSDKIDRQMFMKALEDIDEDQLQKMMEKITGQSCYENRDSILGTMSSMSDDNFQKAILSFEPEGKQQIISNLLKEKPELFEEFSSEALTHPFKSMEKPEILKSLVVLDTAEMLPMVQEMPQELMALIATQINPQIMAQLLCANFKDVIAECGMNLK